MDFLKTRAGTRKMWDDLEYSTSAHRRKAKLADGLSPWAPIVGVEVLLAQLRLEQRRRADMWVRPARRRTRRA